MSQKSKARPLIMAASTAILAVTGAWYGAGLKEKQEYKEVLFSILAHKDNRSMSWRYHTVSMKT